MIHLSVHLSRWEWGVGGYLTASFLLMFRVHSAVYFLLSRHPHSLCRLHATARGSAQKAEKAVGRVMELSQPEGAGGRLAAFGMTVALLLAAVAVLVCFGAFVALFTVRNLLWWGQRAWWWAPERCRHCPGNQARRRTRQLARLLPAASGWPG